MTIFALPDLGEGLSDAEVVRWHVAVGDEVALDDPLVSVDTDKALVEIPSPWAGRIARLLAEPGDVLRIGDALVDFESDGRPDPRAVVGQIAESRADALARPQGRTRERVVPAIRHLARRLGVELERVPPSGPRGRITRQDIERAATSVGTPDPREPRPAAGPPLRGPRRAMARNMERAHAQVVPATVVDDADVDSWSRSSDPTLRLVRAVLAACRAEPALNATFDGGARTLHESLNLGIAVDTSEGLLVPVVRDVGALDDDALHQELGRLRAHARDRTLSPDDLRGATLTLSNFGTIGGRYASLVVVPPQVAIVGAGRISGRAAVSPVDGSTLAARRALPLSLTFDHRVVTGGEAARFLEALIVDLGRGQ